ncbi:MULTISPECIES: hypothetical protein [Streptomyces]|uniref:hypothetical protein n=1 Tax=Streptomyces TaxID=1883 RepID=UPI00186ABCE1|nr:MULTISPECIES: hypothetical protein [Streptomyces]
MARPLALRTRLATTAALGVATLTLSVLAPQAASAAPAEQPTAQQPAAAQPSAAQPAAGQPSVSAVTGVVHGGHSVWTRVNPFSGKKPWTTIQGESITATCKRWGADGKWWYWVRFNVDGLTGHVAGDVTNITHSHLDTCS